MKLPPPNQPQEREFFIQRALTDTGFFARHVLGMDTDRDERGNAVSEIGKGGIRDFGPHKELTTFLDDPEPTHRIIMAPRYSYKSSIVEAYIIRNILAHPNISILLFMHEQEIAETRCRQIRDLLTSNETILELFGDVTGPTWKTKQFVTSLRTDHTLQSPTLWVGSPQKIPTGGRPNIVVFDDIVSDQNYKTEKGLKAGIACIERSLSLGSRGERYINVGTPYHPGDAHHWCMDAGWKKLVHLDVGFDVVQKEDRTLDLEGEGRWPHLSIDFLRRKLRGGMSFPVFMSQFKLKVVSGFVEAFHRTQFKPEKWTHDHADLTGYLLTDTAPAGDPKGDMNVLMYVGIDERQRVHLLDVECGYWKMYEFVDRYLAMLQRWQAKVNHRLELWEKGHNYFSYVQHLRIQGKAKGLNITTHAETRNQGAISKDTRIAGLQARFQMGEIFVCDTVPKLWQAGTEMRVLWDPEGDQDIQTGALLPGGDLVEQFVRFPHHMKKDIPDTLSLVDAIDKQTQQRVCFHAKPPRRRNDPRDPTTRQPAARTAQRFHGSSSRFYDRIRTGHQSRRPL